jgi:EAL domain-containing protein (putative c-di-GMP-specific phosphodiesterase class I)
MYRFFTAEMNVQAVERQSIEEDLRCALGRQELSLHYQPIVNLKTGAITGAEALLRWTHPTRGSIPPAQFIPVAEDSGLILPIGAWVLKEACLQAKAWLEAGLPAITLSVNVSALQFRSEGFLETLTKILDETGMNPKSLDIEVTESALMGRGKPGGPILDTMRGKGMHVAIDDFGTGYSSLSYLRNLPLDALKIDQSFVRQISGAVGDTSIVSAVIGMGRNLKLKVIAEGVETAEEMAFLMAQECDEAQGYFFSQPVNAYDFAKLLEGTVN